MGLEYCILNDSRGGILPIIYQKEILPSEANFNSHSASRKVYSEGSISDCDAIEKIAIINNNPVNFHWQNPGTARSATHKGFWYYFTHFLSLNRNSPEHGNVELDMILAKGREYRQNADDVAEQLQKTGQVHTRCSLKAKFGLFIGTVLLLTGSSIGFYMRRTTTTDSNVFSPDDSFINAEEFEYIYSNSSAISAPVISKMINGYYPNSMSQIVDKPEAKEEIVKSVICLDDGAFHFDYLSGKLIKKENQPCTAGHELFPEHNRPSYRDNQLHECKGNEVYQLCEQKIADEKTKNRNDDILNRVITIQGEKCLCPLTTIKTDTTADIYEQQSVGGRITTNSYQENDQTLQRYRDRLIGYIHSYVEVSKNADNKELVRLILTLISKDSVHESRVAQIYLYGTGLYGEKIDEHMSMKVQRQLVGELLSQLLYNKSLDEYLIHSFSVNRYISTTDFKLKILQDNSVFSNGDLTAEMRFFTKGTLFQ